jgi:hypothetical protein
MAGISSLDITKALPSAMSKFQACDTGTAAKARPGTALILIFIKNYYWVA